MPELPEVETVVRYIRPNIVGKTIHNVIPQNNYDKVFVTHTPRQFNELVAGKSIITVERRGKYIVFNLDRGHFLIHLRMTGRLLLNLAENDKIRHLTAVVNFTDGASLYFKDYRKFGRLYYYDSLDYINQKLGVEPLSQSFTKNWLFNNLHNSNRQLKPLLLDQSFIAGLGNIYVDEALWYAKLHPQQKGSSVSRQKSTVLHSAIQRLLQAAIDNQGTTIINFYFGEGKKGNFREQLQVFGRQDEDCPRCKVVIEKIRVAQRGTHICPRCQKI
ncbi:DNA-formamidopyrimidine glycosylase [Candidatus Neomarinimicrobiota bacterium]